MLHAASYRAKGAGPFNIVQADIVIPDVCPVLGIPLLKGSGKPSDHSPSLDRVVAELGYTRGNVVVISHKANRMKSNATLPELEALVAWLRKTLRPS
jgi:hypothetical protein